MTSSSSTPTLLHQPPTVAAAVKVSSVAILHFLHWCLVCEPSQGSLPDRFCLNILRYRVGFRADFSNASKWPRFFFPVAIVPAHLCVAQYQKDFKLRKKKQREGCGISTGTKNLKIEEIYPANKADNKTDKKLCFMIAFINWCCECSDKVSVYYSNYAKKFPFIIKLNEKFNHFRRQFVLMKS